jgi:ketosteroid isomerase-like protein
LEDRTHADNLLLKIVESEIIQNKRREKAINERRSVGGSAMTRQSNTLKSDRSRKLGIVSKFLQIRTSGRFEGWSDIMTSDVVYTLPGDRSSCPLCGSFMGMQGLYAGFGNLHVTFEIIGEIEIEDYLVDGNSVGVHMKSPWRSRGSGKAIEHETFNFYYFERNLIKRAFTFFDTAILAEFYGEEWTANRGRGAPLVGLPRSGMGGYQSKWDLEAFVTPESTSKLSRAAKREIATKLAQARACGRIEMVDQLLADDVTFRISGDPTLLRICGNYSGKAAVRQAFRDLQMIWEHIGDEILDDVLIEDDQIAFRQLNRWRSHGSGMTVSFETANYIQMKEGRVHQYMLFVDTASLARTVE